MPARKIDLETRVFSRIKIVPGSLSTPCWERQAAPVGGGYTQVKIYKVGRKMAHRLAYELRIGPIPDGLKALHKCDNPPCVNPSHLFLGTAADNAADRDAKGRHRPSFGDDNGSRKHPAKRPWGDANGSRKHPERLLRGDAHPARRRPERMARGSAHGIAKLTEQDIPIIRGRYARKEATQQELADEFGVSRRTIGNVINYKIWRHVP